MKIEKVNDSQIRCTLTREDLASRKIKISELAYGTPKAKSLFKDMMEMASLEYGFEADNIPLMIEAIPVNSECIVLIITKVEDPEELDTRFSKFAPQINDEDDDDDDDDGLSLDDELPFADNVDRDESLKDLFDKFSNVLEDKIKEKSASNLKECTSFVFIFDSINEVINVCKRVAKNFCGSSTLYKDEALDEYLLVLRREKMDLIDFAKICNHLSEYVDQKDARHFSEAYIVEHYDSIIANDAVATLAEL